MNHNVVIKKHQQKQSISAIFQSNLQQQIDSLSLQALRSSEKLLNAETYRSLTSNFSKIDQKNSTFHFLQQFINTLLAYAGKLKLQLSSSINKEQYQILEQSVQKSEAQIRKHIKIEQQLKLYLDSLEQKVQQLHYKLQLEEEKYMILFENFRQLDQNHKKLNNQIVMQNQAKKIGHQYQFKSIQLSSNQNMMSRKTKLGLKSRLIMQKLQQRTRKTNQRKKKQLLSITQGEANLKSDTSQVFGKNNSIDRYKKEGQNQYSIKGNSSLDLELTKSLQMKHQKSTESYCKKISKTKAEINLEEGRSKSIMN